MSIELVHYGVKGMRWGVHRSRPEGVSRSTNRAAKKDAKEFYNQFRAAGIKI